MGCMAIPYGILKMTDLNMHGFRDITNDNKGPNGQSIWEGTSEDVSFIRNLVGAGVIDGVYVDLKMRFGHEKTTYFKNSQCVWHFVHCHHFFFVLNNHNRTRIRISLYCATTFSAINEYPLQVHYAIQESISLYTSTFVEFCFEPWIHIAKIIISTPVPLIPCQFPLFDAIS